MAFQDFSGIREGHESAFCTAQGLGVSLTSVRVFATPCAAGAHTLGCGDLPPSIVHIWTLGAGIIALKHQRLVPMVLSHLIINFVFILPALLISSPLGV